MASRQEVAGLYAKLQLETAEFKKALAEATNSARTWSRSMRRETTEAKHAIHMLSESIGLEIPRALQGVMAKLPGISTAMASAFNVAAVALFAKTAIETGKEIYEHFEKAREAAEKNKEKVEKLTADWAEQSIKIEVANDKLRDQIALLEHKPTNSLKTALDEALESSMALSKGLQKNISDEKELLNSLKPTFISARLGATPDNTAARDYVTNYGKDQARIKEQYESQMEGLSGSKDKGAQKRLAGLMEAEAKALRDNSLWYKQHAKQELDSLNADVDSTNHTKQGVYVNASPQRDSLQSVIDLTGSDARMATETSENWALQAELKSLQDKKVQSEQEKKIEEERLTSLSNWLKDKQAQFNLGAGYTQVYWEHVLASYKWGKDATAKIESEIASSTQSFNTSIYAKLSAFQKEQAAIGVEPAGWKPFTQGVDQLASAQEKATAAAARNKAALQADELEYQLATGTISAYGYAVEQARLKDDEYASQRASLSKQLQALKDEALVPGLVDPQNAAKQTDVQSQIDDLDTQQKIRGHADQMAEASATMRGQIDLVFDEMRMKSQETYAAIGVDFRNFVSGMNSATANAITGHGSRKDFSSVFASSAHSLASQSLEKLEGTFLGKGKKRDGQSHDSSIYVTATNGFGAGSFGVTSESTTPELPVIGDAAKLLGAGSFGVVGESTNADTLSRVASSIRGQSVGSATGSSAVSAGTHTLMGMLNDSDTLGGLFGGHLFGSGSIFGGFRAAGGSVTSGVPYVVGERGPEVVIPGMSGSVVPNHQLANLGGSTNYTIDARGTDAAMTQQAVYRGMAIAHAQAVSDSAKNMRDQARRTPR